MAARVAPREAEMLTLTAASGAMMLLLVAAAVTAVLLLTWNPEAGYASRDTSWP